MNEVDHCKKCGSEEIIKIGFKGTKWDGVKKQRFKCKICGYKFIGIKKYINQEMPFVYKSKPIPPQDWPAYTKAQQEHKQGLINIIEEMLDLIKIKQTKTVGRPNTDLKEICFALILKTFSQLSSRRLHGELEILKKLGYVETIPHFTILMKHLRKKETTLILKELLKLSAMPIKQMSSKTFSVDSTGFSTSSFGRWYDHYNGKRLNRRDFLKCHALIENKSNVVVNVIITEATASDSPRFEKLVTETNKEFQIEELSADMAYSSKKNLELVFKIGATPYIPFKKNVSGRKHGSLIWIKTYEFFKKQPQKFYEKYHKRSNSETSFSMIKVKLGSNLKTKNFTSQQNEILLKLIVHNCFCLIHEFYEKNIESYFATKTPKKTNPAN